MSKLFGKTDFKRMRYPVHVILMALTMFYLGKNSFRNIALILRTVMNVRVSHNHQQLVYPLRPNVPKHCDTAHSGLEFQL